MTDQEKSAIPFGRWREPLRISHAVLCCAILLLLPFFLWWMDRWALGVAPDAYMNWKNLAANIIPAFALLILLAALSGRVLWSAAIVSGLCAVLFIASKIKFQTLGQTFVLQDFYFLKSLDVASLRLFISYVDGVSKVTMLFAAVAALSLLIVAFLWEGKIRVLPIKIRICGAVLGVVGGVCVVNATWPANIIYTEDLIRPDKAFEPFGVLHGGLVSSVMYRNVQLSNIDLEVDESALAAGFGQLREKHLYPSGGHDQALSGDEEMLPDIIVILSESFMDPFIISGMDKYPDLLPNFRRIASHSMSGYMYAPAYGGGTLRTEFEVLTGMPMAAFPDVQYPYPELPVKNIPGLASFLTGRQYRPFAVHGHPGHFWNRNVAYKGMGIADFKTADYFQAGGYGKDGLWHSDESMTDIILEQLSEQADKPAFAVAISMQAHGPYRGIEDSLRDLQLYQSIALPTLTADADSEFRGYLYHIIQADRQLGRLVDALEQRERPYRLVFFGDHLPALTNAWAQLSFVDGRQANQQKVPWLIAGGGFYDASHIKYSWQLPSALLENAGLLEPGGYFAFSAAVGAVNEQDEREYSTSGLLGKALQAAAHANITGSWGNHAHE